MVQNFLTGAAALQIDLQHPDLRAIINRQGKFLLETDDTGPRISRDQTSIQREVACIGKRIRKKALTLGYLQVLHQLGSSPAHRQGVCGFVKFKQGSVESVLLVCPLCALGRPGLPMQIVLWVSHQVVCNLSSNAGTGKGRLAFDT